MVWKMKIYEGVVYLHFETGYEGWPWAFHDKDYIMPDGIHWSYEGMHILDPGDFLVIYRNDVPVYACFAEPEFWWSYLKQPESKLLKMFADECKAKLVHVKDLLK